MKVGERRVVKFVLKASQLPKSGVAGIAVGGRQPGGSNPGVLTTTLSIAP